MLDWISTFVLCWRSMEFEWSSSEGFKNANAVVAGLCVAFFFPVHGGACKKRQLQLCNYLEE